MRIVHGLTEAHAVLRARGEATDDRTAEDAVRATLEDVRMRGDAAVREATTRFDGVTLDTLLASNQEIEEAVTKVDASLKKAMDVSASRIRAYYEKQQEGGFIATEEGAVLGQLIRPIESVGVYAPGGTAPLFSTVLMSAVPARVAGVERLTIASPPRPDGSLPPEILYAAQLVDAEYVLKAGGAQAIAAMAFGTESLPRVDKIVGPGNRYVVAAKRLVYGEVGIESLPGPTETLVVAGPNADPTHAASDLLAQAEHLDAQPVLVTWSESRLHAILDAAQRAMETLPTRAAAEASMNQRGLAILVDDEHEALEVANAYAPEHLCLLVDDPWRLLPEIRNAGGIFLGAHSMEALGDYVAGPSHVMPTNATARFASFINLRDFQKVIPLVYAEPGWVNRIGPHAVTMARAEGLEAHARAVLARLEEDA